MERLEFNDFEDFSCVIADKFDLDTSVASNKAERANRDFDTELLDNFTDEELANDIGKEKLLGDDAALYIDNSISDKQLLACDKITEKKLFFSSELEEQLSLLRNSLDKDYYEGLRARLEENNLPKGIAVLLYGEPGTGKTE